MTLEDRLSNLSPIVRSIVRVVAALLFFSYGFSKMFGFPAPITETPFTLLWFAGAIEFVASGFLTVGLFSRCSALIMSGMMAIGYFMHHAPHGVFPQLNGGNAPILFSFIFLYIVFAGPGPWSIDAKLVKRRF